jgi:hypothetical protein
MIAEGVLVWSPIIHRRTKHAIDEAAWRIKADEYVQKVERARKNTWRNCVNKVNKKIIWRLKNWITNTPTSTFIPTLDGHATTNEQKFITLQEAFFPKPPPADLSDISSTTYPQEIPYEPLITIRQIREAINRLAPDKAPDPDEISNRVLKNTLHFIERHLQILTQASLNLGYFPKSFKHTTTIVLRKPRKPNYTKAKAYRPIALENTLGKVMESIIAEILSYLTETHELLPPQHYGGRPGRSAEDALMILSENIHQAWREKKIYTAIFMDVAGAFNNVHHERLIHNLRKRRIPQKLTSWIASFLQDRSTQLQFNGAKSGRISTPAWVPQGSPLSPLLYMFYNADFLDIAKKTSSYESGIHR